ncbi:MAG: ZIP family metal transporter [Coriobacteriales bacterium]|jgi:ZIP family zinc transporter
MSALVCLLLVTCITGIGSGVLGALIATLFNIESNRTVSILLSFAAGLMLSIICFDFIPEALELESGIPHVVAVVAFVSAGAAVVGVLGHVVDMRAEKRAHCCALDDPLIANALDDAAKEAHLQHHDDAVAHHAHVHGHNFAEGHTKESLKMSGIVMAIAIAMHNLPAGMSVGASFAIPDGSLIGSGILISILIGLHSIPESMSLAIPFLHSGYSKGRTVGIAALVGFTMVVGAVIGFVLGAIDMFWLSMSLAFASGAMLYVLFGEILPESFMLFHSKKPTAAVIVGLIFGLLIVNL